MRLHSVVLNWLSTGTTLPYLTSPREYLLFYMNERMPGIVVDTIQEAVLGRAYKAYCM
jgi:hypothetical protein